MDGDILAVEIGAEGWNPDVTIEGLSTGGSYDLGWTSYIIGSNSSGSFVAGETITQSGTGATAKVMSSGSITKVFPLGTGLRVLQASITGTPNNSDNWTGETSGAVWAPSPSVLSPYSPYIVEDSDPKIAFTVTSLGFDDDGEATTIQRMVYATHAVRKPYPDEATNQETAAGGNVTVRVSLSDYIFAKDKAGVGNSGTDVSVTILSGFYTQAGTSNNGFSGTATNNSTAAYPKVVGNWTWPGYERVTSTVRARCVAFHRSGRLGRPVRCVKFSLTDGTATVTSTVTSMQIGSGMSADQVPVAEYYSDLSVATMADKTAGTLNFIAYPWVGDSDSVLDTSTGTAQPTPLVGPIKILCDKSDNYGGTDVVVDASAADDLSGGTAAAGSVSGGSDPSSWKTIGKAIAQAVARNNSVNGHNDMGYVAVYLKAGTYSLMGSSNSYGTTPLTYCEIKPYPGVSASSIKINSQSGNFIPAAARIKFSGGIQLGDGTTTGANVIGGGATVWIHQCTVNYTANSWFTGTNTILHLTQSTGTGVMKLAEFGTAGNAPGVVRGNLFNGTGTLTIIPYCFVGNKKTAASTNGNGPILTSSGLTNAPIPVNWVVYNNVILNYSATSGTLLSVNNGATDVNSHGGALIQNVLECTNSSSTTGAIGIASDGTTGTPINNILVWHLTVVGKKMNGPYNSKGTAAAYREFWSLKNNIFWDWNQKDDRFTGDGGADGARIGNWAVGNYHVGCSGNINGDQGNGFQAEFPGLNSVDVNWNSGGALANTYFKFTDYKAFDGTSSGTGGGTYTLESDSPAKGIVRDYLLPSDLAGNTRTATLAEDAGAYAAMHAPVITDDPDSVTKNEGESVTFFVTATGNPTPTYQWRKDGVNISGATSSTYEIASVSGSDAGDYDCVVTNSEGSATSDAATLTVNSGGGSPALYRLRLGLGLGLG